MKFEVHISTENAAFYGGEDADTFEPGPQLAVILRDLAIRVEHEGLSPERPVRLFDRNGNRVGFAQLTEQAT